MDILPRFRTCSLPVVATAALVAAALWLAWPAAVALAVGPPAPTAAQTVCYARVASAPGVTYGPGVAAVQQAVDAASDGDTVQVAGACRGVQARDAEDPWSFPETYTQTVIITKSLTLQGGYDPANWTQPPDPAAHPTTLDAQRGGRVVAALGHVTVTLAGLNVVNGWLDPSVTTDEGGAGVYNYLGSTTLSHVNVLSNTAYRGGGVEAGDLTIVGGLIQNNYAAMTGGGLELSGRSTVTGTTFISNTTAGFGGACSAAGGPSTIANALFVGNAGWGGALCMSYSGIATLEFSTIVGRASPADGPAILAYGAGAVVANNIVASYTVPLTTALGFILESNNLFFNAEFPHSNGIYPMGNSWSGDPLFVDPASGNYRLASALSPAVDGGINTPTDAGIAADIDGNSRPQGGGFDLGAYESSYVAQGDCHARLPASGQIFTSSNAAAVQRAVTTAQAEDLVQVAGTCRGAQPYGGATAAITQTLTLQGGYDYTDWAQPPDPVAHPTTLDGDHGGHVVQTSAPVTLEDLNVINGQTNGFGGGIIASDALTLTHVNVISNTASDFAGGLYVQASPLTIVGGLFQNNRTDGSGGAMWVTGHDTSITGTQFLNNYAGDKGGACFADGWRIVNALFAGNQSGDEGGALSLPGFYTEESTVLFSTIVGGSAGGSGSAVYVPGYTLHVTDTIIAGYTTGINNAGGTVTEDYNLFFNTTPTAGTVASGGHSLTGDPAFVGGHDYHLTPASAARDAGLDEGVYTDLEGGINTPVRPQGAGYDIGAYEFPYVTALAIHKSAHPDPVQAGATLTYTIRLTNTGTVTLTAAVTDTLPAQVAGPGPTAWAGFAVGPGATWVRTVTGTVQLGYRGTLTNVVRATTLEGATGAYTATSQASFNPALAIGRSANPDPVQAGATLTYAIRLTNTGDVTLHAAITCTLPAQVSPNTPLVWAATLTPGGAWITDVVRTVQAGYSGPLVDVLRVTTPEGPSGIYTGTTLAVACPALTEVRVNRFDDVYRSATMCSQCQGVAGDCSLREAIERANLSAPDQVTIYVPAGTFELTLPESPVAEGHGNAGGDLNVTGNVVILGGQ